MAARRSASLAWGLLLSVRRPLASTSPRAEFCASWATTSGVGRIGRDRDGLIEQFRGRDAGRLQGHEALENQRQRQDGARNQGPDGPARGLYDRQQFLTPLTIKSRGDYGPGRNSRRRAGEPDRAPQATPSVSLTFSVDNFVGNRVHRPRQTAPIRALPRLMKNYASKNCYKSMACTCLRDMRAVLGTCLSTIGTRVSLWTSAASVYALKTGAAYV